MSYSNTGLRLLVPSFAGSGNIWLYRSTDAAATVDTSGYISDGGKFGMLVGDLVLVQDTDNTYLTTSHQVVSVNATTGAVDLADGVAISSVTNSD